MPQLQQNLWKRREKVSSPTRMRQRIPRQRINRRNCAEPAARRATTPSNVRCCRRCPWTRNPKRSGNSNYVTAAYFRVTPSANAKSLQRVESAEKSATMSSFAAESPLPATATIIKELTSQGCLQTHKPLTQRIQQPRHQQRRRQRL